MKAEEPTAVLRVVRGDATAEEIAALVAVLGALKGSAAESAPTSHPGWSAPAARLGAPAYGRSPGGWRGSALPR